MRRGDLIRFGRRITKVQVHDLPAHGVLRLPRGRGLTVQVERGQVWVTRAGDLEDHVLEEGAVLELDRYGRAVAWALQASRLAVHPRSEPVPLPIGSALAR